MANSYPDAPVLEESNAKYPNGYSEVTGYSVWTWSESASEWIVTDRPDKTNGYGQ